MRWLDEIKYIREQVTGHTVVEFKNGSRACSCGIKRGVTPNLRDTVQEVPGMNDDDGKTFTRRQYLTIRAFSAGATIFGAIEAVATTLLEHPEWDPNEERTWKEWEGR